MLLRSLAALLMCLWLPLAWAADEEETEGEQEEHVSYVELKPFVANYGDGTKLRFVKCEITIQVGSEATHLAVNQHIASIRNDILFLLMAQTEESMKTVAAQETLAKNALQLVRQLIVEEEGEAMVSDLFFVSFVAQ